MLPTMMLRAMHIQKQFIYFSYNLFLINSISSLSSIRLFYALIVLLLLLIHLISYGKIERKLVIRKTNRIK